MEKCTQCEGHVRLIREVQNALIRAGKNTVAGYCGRFAECIDEMAQEIRHLTSTKPAIRKEEVMEDTKEVSKKEALLAVLNSIPDDLLEDAYNLDLIGRTIQMHFNSRLAKKYYNNSAKLDDNGYVYFSLEVMDDTNITVTMT